MSYDPNQPPQQPNQGQPYPPQGQPYPPQQPYYPPQQPPKKSRKGLWITLGIIAALVIFGCVGVSIAASNAAKSVSTSLNKVATNTSTDTSTTSGSSAHHKVGESVSLDNTWQMKVISTKTSQGDEFQKPKSGNTFLLIKVSAKNISSESQGFSSLIQLTLRDKDGAEVTPTFLTGSTPPDGKVAAGDQISGTVVYEVPTSYKGYTLHVLGSLTGDPAIYDL